MRCHLCGRCPDLAEREAGKAQAFKMSSNQVHLLRLDCTSRVTAPFDH